MFGKKFRKVNGKWKMLYKITYKGTVTRRNIFGIKRKKKEWITKWVDWKTYKRWKWPEIHAWEERFFL